MCRPFNVTSNLPWDRAAVEHDLMSSSKAMLSELDWDIWICMVQVRYRKTIMLMESASRCTNRQPSGHVQPVAPEMECAQWAVNDALSTQTCA